jgi:DNA-binding response OmpR family regulator
VGKRVLIVEDEPRIAGWVQTYFERAGYQAALCDNGSKALETIIGTRPDLLILDLNLPGKDGLQICKQLRQLPDHALATVPVIMLTARVEEADKLKGLGLGADDYVTKPFSPKELVARAQALLRRAQDFKADDTALLQDHGLLLDRDRHLATLHSKDLNLTRSEFALVLLLVAQPGRVWSRQQLIDQALGSDFDGFDRTVDAHIKNLRHKLREHEPDTQRIDTVFGVGYRYVAPQATL